MSPDPWERVVALMELYGPKAPSLRYAIEREISNIEAEAVVPWRAALLRHGAHDHDCPAEMSSPFTGKDQGCSCGLVETWNALGPKP